MKLNEILSGISYRDIIGNHDEEIDKVSQDTREDFIKNTLYFAVPGTQINGHDFIGQAIEKGAVVVVCEYIPEEVGKNITYVLVDSIVETMGKMVANFYGNPSKKLKIIAVTGTNGKTTIATLLYQSLLLLKKKVALFSTAGEFMNGEEIKTQKNASSSMEVIELQKNLKLAVDENCEYVCIEATSHALDQNRLYGTKITGAIYTNLSQDHLDYHKNFDDYAQAKQKLFSLLLDKESFAVINIDDIYGVMMVEKTLAKIVTYGNKDIANPIYRNFVFHLEKNDTNGTMVFIDDILITTPLLGLFNMYNLVAVYGGLRELGFEKKAIIGVLPQIKGASGRMELVRSKDKNIIAVVDYAHTPDALKNVLATLQDIPHRKIITVVGAGGDRDKTKRPFMGAITQKMSDYSIFTSDNPRTENPKEILHDILDGCNREKNNYEIIIEREGAIKKAIKIAEEGDIILVAGKGHEDYQIIGTKKIHFDDKEILKKLL